MMTFRKISAGGMGKLIRAYLTENSNFAPEPDEGSPAAVLTKYYGRDARVSWRQDMAPEVAAALGIDITKPPTPEALDRLFEAKRGNDGGAWSAVGRDISAYDLTNSPEKSVSLAFAFAKTDEEPRGSVAGNLAGQRPDYAVCCPGDWLGAARRRRKGRVRTG